MKLIGIDPGKMTGLAIYDTELKELLEVKTTKLHLAFIEVLELHNQEPIKVYFEDARLRKWFGAAGRERLKGVGSVNRDCSAWQDFLEDFKIEYEKVAPKNIPTKLNVDSFTAITKYQGRTSNHGRDAAMIVYGR